MGAKWIVTSEGVLEGATIEIEDGRIVGFGAGEADVDVGNVALFAGLVNAHSHAFQRGIRGRTEYRDPSRGSDTFWTWREKMYTAVLDYSAEEIYDVSRAAFLEMVLSGITTVGEFHYVHHRPDGIAYENPNHLSDTVIEAARSVGLRIALLRVAYHEAGPGQAASLHQRRFVESTPADFLERTQGLYEAWADEREVTVGVAPHSVRAVPPEWLAACAEWSERREAPFHIHVCEQRAELEQCDEAYGKSPIELLSDEGALSERTTLVHATHITDADLELIAYSGATVCGCPTTERNLGDGFLPARRLTEMKVPIALGSDSQTVIDLWEEMRCVEYHERLREESRNVLAEAAGGVETAKVLAPMGSRNGGRSLGLKTGALAPGEFADIVAVDLGHPSLWGTSRATVMTDAIFSMSPSAVRDVWVSGKRIVERGEHPLAREIARKFAAVQSRK